MIQSEHLVGILKSIARGIGVQKLVDRDDMTDEERPRKIAEGVRVLRRRELEEYLSDPEVLRTFLQTEDCEEVVMETVVRKRESLLIGQHGPKNIKDVSRDLFAAIRSDTGLPNLGNNREEFASDHPLENTRTCPKCFGDGHRLGIGLAQDLDHLVFAEASLWRGTERKRMNLAWKGSLGTLVSVRDPSGDRRRGMHCQERGKADRIGRGTVRRLSSGVR